MGVLATANKAKNLFNQITQNNLGFVRIQATLGKSSHNSQSTNSTQTNHAATINTAGNLIFDIQGKGSDSDLLITGSHLAASNLHQKVTGDVIYQASDQYNRTNNSNFSKNAGIGVYATANVGTNSQSGAGVNIHGNFAKGGSQEHSTTHTSSQIKVTGNITNDIGGHFTLDGANLDAKHLTGNVAGDLIVKSRQDSYQYDSKQQNIGISADLDFSGKLQNAHINTGKERLNAKYAQVAHQSGIKANASDLQVQGQGQFFGGYLITDKDNNHSQFKKGIFTHDIKNYLNYQGDALQIGVVFNQNKPNSQLELSSLGYGKIAPVYKTSITSSAITDKAGIFGINTDNFTDKHFKHSLNPIIDNEFADQKDKFKQELNEQIIITNAFGQEAPKWVAEFSQNQIN